MTIVPRETVRAALESALKQHPCPDAAAQSVAQALCLPVEAVLECMEVA